MKLLDWLEKGRQKNLKYCLQKLWLLKLNSINCFLSLPFKVIFSWKFYDLFLYFFFTLDFLHFNFDSRWTFPGAFCSLRNLLCTGSELSCIPCVGFWLQEQCALTACVLPFSCSSNTGCFDPTRADFTTVATNFSKREEWDGPVLNYGSPFT